MMTFLNLLLIIVKIIGVFAVIALVLISALFLVDEYHENKREEARDALRNKKEEDAAINGGFFEESYVPGFTSDGSLIYRGATVPSDGAWEFYQVRDNLVDTAIITTAEEF